MDFSDLTRGACSDLALERHRANTEVEGVTLHREIASVGVWERISITTDAAAASIERPKGHYNTLTLPELKALGAEEKEDAKDEIARELCRLVEALRTIPDRILVVGLGNAALAPDAIGSACAAEVCATMQLSESDRAAFLALDCSEIAVLTPGVTASTGIETLEIIKGVTRRIIPDLVIAVDALAARSPARLGCTVQISDTGILPGSALGRVRRAVSHETLGVPVIAVGVPTVIGCKHLFPSEPQKTHFVAPTDIGITVKAAAEIIGGGINQAFGVSY